MADDIAKL